MINTPPQITVRLPDMRVAGYFYVDVIDASSGEVRQHLEFPNLITDNGMNLIGNGSSFDTMYSAVQVGTGTTTPTVSDTNLATPLLPRSTTNGGFVNITATNTVPEYAFRRYVRVFNEFQVNGLLSEVAFWNSDISVMVNRSLLKDAQGNPTTITKTSEDILRIVFEIRIFAPQIDIIGSTQYLPGIPTAFTIRPSNVGLAPGWNSLLDYVGTWNQPSATAYESDFLASRTGDNTPIGGVNAPRVLTLPYTNGTFYRDVQYSWIGLQANFPTGIGLVGVSTWRLNSGLKAWQISFTPKIPKTEDYSFYLLIRQSWSRL